MSPAEVVRVERIDVEAPRDESAGERSPDEHADAAFPRERQDVLLGLAVEKAVLVLQRSYGSDCERPLDRFDGMVGDTAVPDLAFGDEPHHLAPRILDRCRGVNV